MTLAPPLAPPLVLSKSMLPHAQDRAGAVLQAYFSAPGDKNPGYIGGAWDAFDPSGTRSANVNTFTAEDLVACSFLAAPISGRAAREILGGQAVALGERFARIDPGLEFVAVDGTRGEQFRPVRELYTALVRLPSVGPMRATKLMARKRPNLVPIVDQVIRRSVFPGLREQWAPLIAALRADDCRLHRHLHELHAAAELPEAVTTLRVFDILAWMDGTGSSETVLGDTRGSRGL